MNRLSFVAATAAAALALSSCAVQDAFGLFGSGRVVQSERPVAAFVAVHSAGSAQVRIHKAATQRVVVTADDNIQELFEVGVKGGTLWLSFKPGTSVSRVSKLVVDVYTPELDGLALSGSGGASFEDRFSGERLDLSVGGSGSVSGELRYSLVAASISGSGSVRLSGEGRELRLSSAGSGSFRCAAYRAETVDVALSGSGSAEVYASESLSAAVVGSGSVRYRGSPARTQLSALGSGRVIRAGD